MSNNIKDKLLLFGIALIIAIGIYTAIIADKIENLSEMQKDTLQMLAEQRIKADNDTVEAEDNDTADEFTSYYVGEYTITHYCECIQCCGKSDGITASGAEVTEGITVAAEGFPFGTKLLIDGNIYIVQDRFGRENGNRIDIYVPDHNQAIALGKYKTDVYIVEM